MVDCEICRSGFPTEEALADHLRRTHQVELSEFREKRGRFPPVCARAGCTKPVRRSTGGGWHICCSPFCALKVKADIPLSF